MGDTPFERVLKDLILAHQPFSISDYDKKRKKHQLSRIGQVITRTVMFSLRPSITSAFFFPSM